MSVFSDLWDQLAAPCLAERFAGSALCTQPGKTERTITVIVWPKELAEQQTQNGLVRKYMRLIGVPRTLRAANGGEFLETPGLDDAWTVEGEDFAVEAIQSQTESETVLQLVKREIHERTREGLRRRN